MIYNLIVAVIAVPVLTASFALAILWYVRSSTSENTKGRQQIRFVEVVLSLGVFMLSVATTPPSSKQWRAYLPVLGFVASMWAYRRAKILLNRRKHV